MTTTKTTARLVKTGMAENLATHLVEKGITSAVQLAKLTVADIRRLLGDANLGLDSAEKIKKRAVAMKALVDNHLVTVRGQVAPSYKALASTNTTNNIINFHEGMESYPEMFGSDDYAPGSEFDSVIGPAAYLVDLMRYINEYIVQPSDEADKPLRLKSRRPDIWNIPLDMENTVDEIPYLQLVNEILTAKLDAEGKVNAEGTINETDKIGDASEYMAETIFPFNLPFNTPLEQIRKYLEALQTELYDVFNTFNIDPAAQTREYLKLSPEQTTYLTTPLVNKDSLNLAYGNIKTDNLQPHFTGITDDTNLGSLTNAAIFMNQVGFTQTSQLESLFYQNINRSLSGSNTLLNNLFVNKSSNLNHLVYSPAPTDGPQWEDELAWQDPSYYSTIRRVVAGDQLYLLVRTTDGIDTWIYNNAHNNWVLLTKSSPAWSDDAGWDTAPYYSTIQVVASRQNLLEPMKLYLFGRYTDGLHTWVFDPQQKTWTPFPILPELSDDNHFNLPQYYSTIKTISIGSRIFLLARSATGVQTWYLELGSEIWMPLVAADNIYPDFSDANGWNVPQCYLTIQVASYNGKLFLTGRSPKAIETWWLDFSSGIVSLFVWVPELLYYPQWDDASGWSGPQYYLTIQQFNAAGSLWLIASGPNGIELYLWVKIEWIYFPTNAVPNWLVSDWQDPSAYLTIRAFAVGNNNIGLIGRKNTGIHTWLLQGTTWSQVETNSLAWSDASGWNDPAYYATIDTLTIENTPVLSGITKRNIEVWRFNSLLQTWVKDKLVQAVLELENNGNYTHLDMAVLDRLNRFIRLSTITGWSYEDLDWAMIAAGAEDITPGSIAALKDLQWIMNTLQLTAWQVTVFWHDIKTYGEGYGPVSTAPFDIVFNQPMPFGSSGKIYHPIYPANPNYQDQPVVWQTDGKTAGSITILFRLLAALNLDARNVKALADYLKIIGLNSSPNEITLTVENLSAFYRFALLANSVKLSIPELAMLLKFLGLDNRVTFTASEVIAIINTSQWMVDNNLTIYQLNYICNGVVSRWIDTGFDPGKIPDLLKTLSEAATQWYLTVKQLQFENLMNPALSQSFYNTLSYKKYIDDRGIMLVNNFSFENVSGCFVVEALSFADQKQLRPVGKVGNVVGGTASQIMIPFNPNSSAYGGKTWMGSVSIWFWYDGAQTNTCTLYSLDATDPAQIINITSVQASNGNIVLNTQAQSGQVVCKIPGAGWHFLVISYRDQLISLDTQTVTSVKGLTIPANVVCNLSIGNAGDSFITDVAELRLFDPSVKAADIVAELYPSAKNPNDPVPGNSNYWPLNDGQGATTAKDVAGDINGWYAGNNSWRIIFVDTIPGGFPYLDANGHLTSAFDPVTSNPDYQPFVDLWKTIVNLRNILNKTIGTQKQGTLQKLANFYHVNKDLSVYADYMAEQEAFPNYVQTLLTYRFSLNWPEFSLDLDRATPYISSYLVAQFAANNITVTETASINRLSDDDGNPANQWLISESSDDVYFLDKREDALDIYKLLPAGGAIFANDNSFPTIDYQKFNIDKKHAGDKPAVYFSDRDDEMAVVFKIGNYVRVTIFPIPGADEAVVNQIRQFISDLGLLLYTVKALKLSDKEFKCIVDNTDRFFNNDNSIPFGVFSLSQLKAVLLFKKLDTTYTAEDKSFADYFYLADDIGSLVKYVAPLTDWDAQGLRQLSQWNCLYTPFATIDIPGSITASPDSIGAGGNYAIAGYAQSNAVFVYQLTGEKWEPLPSVAAPGGSQAFGAAVAIQNYTDNGVNKLCAIVSDTSVNGGAGTVFVFEYNFNTEAWKQTAQLTAPDSAAGASFGSAVTIWQDDMLLIGAPDAGAGKSGNAYLFKNISGTWTCQQISFNIAAGDTLFGNSVSLFDNIVAIGSANNAYIFKITNSSATAVIPPVPCSKAAVATNGDFAVMSSLSGSTPAISYVSGVSTSKPSGVQQLTNADFSGVCMVALEEDTLMINDSANTCFVYYIQENVLSFRQSIKLVLLPVQTNQPWPVALGDGNLVAGGVNLNKPTLLFFGNRHNVEWFDFVAGCFKLANKLGVSIGSLLQFINLSQLEMKVRCRANGPADSNNKDIYAAYENYANKLAAALAMGHSPEEWETVYAPLRNRFLELQRNALAGYMIFSLRNQFTDITNINDLYELLLTDVGSAGCRTVSRIREALNSLQLYIERCRMQLEPHTSIEGSSGGAAVELNAAEVEWNWMSHYRIWEANREVFLFPEKYIDPTLRKDKTNAYADLQNKLSQSNLTNDSAVDAFQTYFQDLEALTGLTIVSYCLAEIATFVNGHVLLRNTWFIFAKTKNRDEGYYWRTADAILPGDTPDTWMNWTNWQKINTSIKADNIATIFSGGRPYIFWLDIVKQQVTGNANQYSDAKSFNYETKLYYCYQQANGQWTSPHEVPDPTGSLNFNISTTNATLSVTLPDRPSFNVYSSYMDIVDCSITITTDGTMTPASPLTLSLDNVLNLYERDIWTFTANTNDVRGKNSLGSANGITYPTGTDLFANRGVMNFGGYTGGLVFPTPYANWLNESFTLGIWVNGALLNLENWPIICPSGSNPKQFTIGINSGYAYFGANGITVTGKTLISIVSWTFVVFRYDANTKEQTIFVNGVRDGQGFASQDPQGNSALNFGTNGQQFMAGQVADLFIFHTPVSDTNIMSIYRQYNYFEISDDIQNLDWKLDGDLHEAQHDTADELQATGTMTYEFATGVPFYQGRLVLGLNWPPNQQQYLTVPKKFNTFFNHSFTIGIWINSAYPANYDWPILASAVLTPGQSFSLLVRNGYAFMDFYESSTTGATQLSAATWHYLVFTYDEDTQVQSIYVDGNLDASSGGHQPYLGDSTLHIGFYNDIYTAGQMANLLFVQDALSATEIKALYQNTFNPNLPAPPVDFTPALNNIQTANGKRIQQFNEDLFMGGAGYLYGKNSVNISKDELSAHAPYGKYMWELFYHIPMLIAQLLAGNNKYEDAKTWYEYIFKPSAADNSNDRFWQLGYFRSLGKPEDIVDILTDNSQKDAGQILIYDLDPFDPEAIAYLRPGAFEKKTVISYIGNLADWGDSLFSQYTWETITQAEMLYVLAKEILGKRPGITGPFSTKTPMTIEGIEKEYQGDIPQFVIEIEDMQPALHADVQVTPRLSASVANFYFGIPENDELTAYQNLVDTRLYEIRNCLNILGQLQSLALFEPPINPMALVAASAAGLSLADVPISNAINIPYYRFSSLIDYAKSVTQSVMDFGSMILAALEKTDAEALALLSLAQEKIILDMTTSIKERLVQEAIDQALVLEQSLAGATERVNYYTNMLAQPVSVLEGLALGFNLASTVIEVPAVGLRIAAVVGHLVPTVFGFADGDFSPGGAIEAGANALSTESTIYSNLANMTNTSASYVRRAEEWGLQLKLAQYDVASINVQKTINAIQVQSAQQDLAIHLQTITNNDNLRRFYQEKFTNKELYQWMTDQISSVYYQAFQMAQDLALKAQMAYQFELNTNENIITYGYWDNTRRGLLSGEKLMAGLNRLGKAYIDNNQRSLEIQKIVSLRDLNISELDNLVKTGTCRISLTEQLYDWDYPGHYNRKIKSVSITIPAIVGPYQTIKATLVQQSNKVVTKPDLNTVKYLVSKDKTQQPLGSSLRINWRPNQQIIISKASGDSGLFELNFNDERYLPFEGTGAVSDWQLSIPQSTNALDLNSISDVILYINYTAQDGGAEFAQQVSNLPEIKNYKGTLVVSIKQQFNQAWNTFMTTGAGTFNASFQWAANLQSPVIDEQAIKKTYRAVDGKEDDFNVVLTFNINNWTINYDDAKRANLLDVILEIPYTAQLKQ